ncbi:hypothetical protein ACI3L1_15465 [Deinococcus sp. SM5_A1]|uniref:hypothetical protein n=1 Tax=Deinococcus sp. SM5_A1 TaxID=3379094 RepID=UPI00385B55C3
MPHPEDLFDAQTDAIGLFREWASDPNTLIVDTETTRLEGGVWEFAAVRLRHPSPVLAYICQPETEWGEKARPMHVARLAEIRAAPRADVFRAVTCEVLNTSRSLSYGGDSDHAVLERTFPGEELPAFGCILTAYAPIYGEWSEKHQDWTFASLTAALEREQVDVSTLPAEHTAYGDALRAALLVQAVAQQLTPFEEEARDNEEARLSSRPPVWDES